MVISGKTRLIAHIGFPTESFKAPMIYNPWFAQCGADVIVMPTGARPADYPTVLDGLSRVSNLIGALVTMPHKVTTLGLVAEASPAARIAGACNAIRLRDDGRWIGDQFDGEGFVRGVRNKGFRLEGCKAIVTGAGGVGSAIAASLAGAGIAAITLFDRDAAMAEALGQRLREHYPGLEVRTGSNDPAGHDLIVNATPLGMNPGDPLPYDIDRIAPTSFVGEVVMKTEITPLLQAVRAKGCPTQVGTDMLFEMIPAYLEFFDLPVATPAQLRTFAQIEY